MNFNFLIQARMQSTRFPGKALEKIYKDYTLIDIVYKRVMMANFSDDLNVIVLTTNKSQDDPLVEHLKRKNIRYFRGDESNVYKRYKNFFQSISLRPDYFFRICSDNPFIEPAFLDDLSNIIINGDSDFDYFSHRTPDGTPSILTHYGFFGELIRTESFMNARQFMKEDYFKEHVTPVFYKTDHFKASFIEMDAALKNNVPHFNVDTKEDLEIIKNIIAELDTIDYTFKDVMEVVEANSKYKAFLK